MMAIRLLVPTGAKRVVVQVLCSTLAALIF